jgi:hypothetical protein
MKAGGKQSQNQSLAYSLTLKIEATFFSRTLVDLQQATVCYIPEDIRVILHNHCHNVKAFINLLSLSFQALSKEHAVIEIIDEDNHLIYDLGSRNKTRLGKVTFFLR